MMKIKTLITKGVKTYLQKRTKLYLSAILLTNEPFYRVRADGDSADYT